MAKLYFRYGAMECGKTTALLQVAYNYRKKDMKVIVIKPYCDTKGSNMVVSRIGISNEVDLLVKDVTDLEDRIPNDIECIIVDEAQFFSEEIINKLYYISKVKNISVICYGLRCDFQGNLFEGSSRLLAIADSIEELKTICNCGKKATFNARKVNSEYVYDGNQVLIDGSESNVEYEPLCGNCYIKKVPQKVFY